MESRLCPVCHKGKVWRRHVRTCSRHCSMTWNTWTPDMQASAVEAADNPKALVDLKEIESELNEVKPHFLK